MIDFLRLERRDADLDKFYGQTLGNLLRMVYHMINVSFISHEAKMIVLQFLGSKKEVFVPLLLKILIVVQAREQTLVLRILRKLSGLIKNENLDEAVIRTADEDNVFKYVFNGLCKQNDV